jgi:hypothetical protein
MHHFLFPTFVHKRDVTPKAAVDYDFGAGNFTYSSSLIQRQRSKFNRASNGPAFKITKRDV